VKYIINIVITIFLSYLFFFCSDQGVSPDRANYVIPEENVRYYKDLQPMFNGKCGFESQCHSPENPVNQLYFDSNEGFYTYIISRTGDQLVDPIVHKENPNFAPLVILLSEQYADYDRKHPSGYGREPLNSNQINGVKTWISEGCRD
jgi:hypothetical protein